jgi:hypothetical protein
MLVSAILGERYSTPQLLDLHLAVRGTKVVREYTQWSLDVCHDGPMVDLTSPRVGVVLACQSVGSR